MSMKIIVPSNKQKRYLACAKAQAEKSNQRHRLGAVLVNSGRIIGKGYNQTGRDSFARWEEVLWTVHAEIDALRFVHWEDLGFTMYLCRVNRRGEFRLSWPCEHCLRVLTESKIRRVFFTLNEDQVGELSL